MINIRLDYFARMMNSPKKKKNQRRERRAHNSINSKYNEARLRDDALCRISPLIMNALRSLKIHKHPLEDTRP